MSSTALHADRLTQSQTRWGIPPPSVMANAALEAALAMSFLAGEQVLEEIVARASRTLGRPWRWLRPLARRYLDTFAGRTRARRRDVIQFLYRDRDFQEALSKYHSELSVAHWFAGTQKMQPTGTAAHWDIPPIESAGALADWLRLNPAELDWFADLKALGYKKSARRLRHYHYRVLSKRFGSIRLIEAPKPRLKELQRQILEQILERIPPHPAAHGFLKTKSARTFIAPHVGRRVVLRMDFKDFFASVCGARIQALFRTLGYPEAVADLLGGICTNAAPRGVWTELGPSVDPNQLWEMRALYGRPHLPQGAPTSPMLANLCAYRVDCRLAGLARAVEAEYTRYANDLAFSGGERLERRVERFSAHVATILREEGFKVHHRKTRVMRQGVRQRLVGLVANQRANVMRADFDRLKATLTNCVRLGPESQNRGAHPRFRAHLEGRVGFVESINPVKAKRLRAIFERIEWP